MTMWLSAAVVVETALSLSLALDAGGGLGEALRFGLLGQRLFALALSLLALFERFETGSRRLLRGGALRPLLGLGGLLPLGGDGPLLLVETPVRALSRLNFPAVPPAVCSPCGSCN